MATSSRVQIRLADPAIRLAGGECWATVFNETAAEVLGFSADTYVSMTSMEERYASLLPLRGARVMATIKKRVKDAYVNYTVTKLEVIDANIE